MSTPIVENVTSLIDHLDFDIQCEGIINENYERDICSNHAVYVIIYDCGCESVKCIECTNRLLAWMKSISDQYGHSYGICVGCNKIRNDDETTVRPL